MKLRWFELSTLASFIVALGSVAGFVNQLAAAPWDPSVADYTGRKARTIYVSKLGDNSDGSSWSKAFHTIQAGLLAVPDDQGGHRVVIRPDTYVEANLYVNHKGAAGAYNALIGDFDGKLGSGATGWVVADGGAPGVAARNTAWGNGEPPFKIIESDAPESGLKTIDWWINFGGPPGSFSGFCWDRWIYRHIYGTGAGVAFGPYTVGEECKFPCTMVVEDCVGIGRFAGAEFAGGVGRKEEPTVFRRCFFMCLDWWGDAGGVYVRAHHDSMPDYPDAIFEDCTIVSPDNAVQVGYPRFDLYTRAKFKDCRLITLNFSEPRGMPSSGVICCDPADKYFHVDLEDCTLGGYKVFGTSRAELNKVAAGVGTGDFSYSLKGKVRAYVQSEQPLPEGFERLGLWPVELYSEMAPPSLHASATKTGQPEKTLTKLPEKWGGIMENTPVIFGNRPLLILNYRDDSKNNTDEYTKNVYLFIRDLATGEEVARFGEGYSFVSAFVEGPVLHVFASECTNHDWFHDIYHFTSTDLKTWKRELAIPREGDEHLFNCSVCRDEQGYLMAYESNQPVQFCFKFARSKDLSHWEKIPGLTFTGETNEYSACPVIRYFKPCYYVIYLHAAMPGHNGWVSFMARSKDLATWQLSPKNPILEAGEGEGINNSDVDLIEIDGKTYVYYATGDQATWGDLKRAVYPGPMREFFESYFPEGVKTIEISAKRGQ